MTFDPKSKHLKMITRPEPQLRRIENLQAIIGEPRVILIDELDTMQFLILQPAPKRAYPVIDKNGCCWGRHPKIEGAEKIALFRYIKWLNEEKLKQQKLEALCDLAPDKNGKYKKNVKIHL